ncbi:MULTISPECIES: hypothetical protein [unclassified Streptomyces]|nr:hypothetical protein [Streptomyces sp. NBC_00340]MCX5138256.1 hypothetical protein [Streptomyces sp. NBC_00340]
MPQAARRAPDTTQAREALHRALRTWTTTTIRTPSPMPEPRRKKL